QTIVEKNCVQVYNADQTAVNYVYIPKQTVSERGIKTVWVKCGNKGKARATAMLLADWEGTKLPTFLVFKIAPSKIKEKRVENNTLRHGFSPTMWDREIRPLQERHDCQIYGNQCAWWDSDLSVDFFKISLCQPTESKNNLIHVGIAANLSPRPMFAATSLAWSCNMRRETGAPSFLREFNQRTIDASASLVSTVASPSLRRF
ncbi:hypothetical protein JG687_00018659, partial [Phytophthora cactorum]